MSLQRENLDAGGAARVKRKAEARAAALQPVRRENPLAAAKRSTFELFDSSPAWKETG